MIKFKFLVENKTNSPGIFAEHGLSIYIQTEEKTILFDTGASAIFAENAKKLNVDLRKVDLVVISHGHYDHTGGIPQFCRENQTAPIYIHKNAFRETYGMKNGQLQAHTSGIKWSRKEVESRLCLTEGLTPITENLFISGTIPQTAKDLQPEQFFEKTEEGSYRPDDMSHEQFLAIKEEGGIFVFSGCSHTGVVNTLNYVNQIFPGEPIKLLVAGMHLYACDKATRETVIDGVIEQNVHQIMPVHCTGIEGICTLKSKLGENCIIATAGDSYEY